MPAPTMTRMGRFKVGVTCVLVAGALIASGCSDDGGADGGGGSSTKDASITAYLRRLPESLRDGESFSVVYGDLDRAADLADSRRPDGDDIEEFVDWLLPLTGVPRDDMTDQVFVSLPNATNPSRLLQAEEFRDELGWSVVDVHSFIEYQVPPNVFAVLSGDFDDERIAAAVGDPDGQVWKVGDEDFGTDLADISAARPLGESLRMALDGGQLAVARSTSPVEEWLANDGGTFADDDDLHAVASALDDAGAYSAMLFVSDDGATVGIGLSVDKGSAFATFVYALADDEAATAGVERITNLIEEGSSALSNQLWSDAFSIDSVEAKNNLVVATLRLEDFMPRSVFQIAFARDNLATLQ